LAITAGGDPIQNPYPPGAGSRPPALTGRDAEIQAFRILIERIRHGRPEKSLLITGLRGVGKTVLLNAFRDVAESAGFKTGEAEVTHESGFRPMMARLGRRILMELNPAEKVKDKVLQAARVLKAFTLKLPGGFEVGVDIDAIRGKADSGNLSEDLSDLLFALGEAARARRTGIVLLLDEIQFLERADLEALIASLHFATQRGLPVTVVGAGLPQLPKLAGEAKSYAERLFDFPMIDRLSSEAAREALVKPARDQGVEYAVDAMAEIVSFTDAYPYFLQEFGKHVWNLADDSPITLADVERAKPAVRSQLDENFFQVRVGRTTAAERRYISAMASLGRGPYKSGDIAAKLGTDSPRVAPLRNQLINKGLVYSPSHGITDFTVPQFDDFARRRLPFRKAAKAPRRR
jgi:hypothetical protein